MTGALDIEIVDDEVHILADAGLVMGFSASMAIHMGTHIMRRVHLDDRVALRKIDYALDMQDPDSEIAEDIVESKFEIVRHEGDPDEITLWLDSQIVVTFQIDAAEAAAKRLIDLGMEIIAAKHPDLAE